MPVRFIPIVILIKAFLSFASLIYFSSFLFIYFYTFFFRWAFEIINLSVFLKAHIYIKACTRLCNPDIYGNAGHLYNKLVPPQKSIEFQSLQISTRCSLNKLKKDIIKMPVVTRNCHQTIFSKVDLVALTSKA